MRHYVTHDGGDQTIYHVPLDRHVRASVVASATYAIADARKHEDDAERTVQASTAASVDATSLTLSAASGPSATNPRRIQLGALTGLVEGHQYMLVGAGGLTELITLDYLDTANNYAYAKHDIRNAFATSDTLQGVEISGTFPTLEAADDDALSGGGGPYIVSWVYTIDGTEYLPADDLYIRRYTTEGMCSEEDVLQAYPRMASRSRGVSDIADGIASATKHIQAELANAGVKPEMISSHTLNIAATYKTIAFLLRWMRSDAGDADDADVVYYEQQFDELMRSALNGAPPSRTTVIDPDDLSANPGGRDRSLNELFRAT
jgi:hypothetical protein